jgi:hypothetical protein
MKDKFDFLIEELIKMREKKEDIISTYDLIDMMESSIIKFERQEEEESKRLNNLINSIQE